MTVDLLSLLVHPGKVNHGGGRRKCAGIPWPLATAEA
jgi:hypothetical protein